MLILTILDDLTSHPNYFFTRSLHWLQGKPLLFWKCKITKLIVGCHFISRGSWHRPEQGFAWLRPTPTITEQGSSLVVVPPWPYLDPTPVYPTLHRLMCPTLCVPDLLNPFLCQSTQAWPRLRAACASSERKSRLNISFGTWPTSLGKTSVEKTGIARLRGGGATPARLVWSFFTK